MGCGASAEANGWIAADASLFGNHRHAESQEMLMSRSTRIIIFGGLAAIIIGAIVLAFWAFSGPQPTWP